MAESRPISFRPLRLDDLQRMFAWRSAEHVSRWWHPITYEELAAECAELVSGVEPVYPLLMLYDGQPIGFVQWYRLWNDGVVITPSYARLPPPITHTTAAIDLFIGERRYLYRGLGSVVVQALLRKHIFSEPDITGCMISPDPQNTAAVRAYAKAGFHYLGTIAMEETGEEEYVMYLAR
ncbi:MAG: GNAT family N-acetyltransferase [Ktedonobacterales bacterium]